LWLNSFSHCFHYFGHSLFPISLGLGNTSLRAVVLLSDFIMEKTVEGDAHVPFLSSHSCADCFFCGTFERALWGEVIFISVLPLLQPFIQEPFLGSVGAM
jgi:hypothetical protein